MEEGKERRQQKQQLAGVQTAGISNHFACLPYRDTGQLTHVHTESCTHATVKNVANGIPQQQQLMSLESAEG